MDTSKIFSQSQLRLKLNAIELIKARESAGLTQAKLAKLFDWTPQRQHYLENHTQEVSVGQAKKIIMVLKSLV